MKTQQLQLASSTLIEDPNPSEYESKRKALLIQFIQSAGVYVLF